MVSILEVLGQASSKLRSDSARLDAEILLAHVLHKDRSYLFTWPEQEVDDPALSTIETLLKQRKDGTPIAYLTGEREFWSLTLEVSPATLIPRPETELLVEKALSLLPTDKPCRVADLGTGSGAIALAIASERPDCQLIACDQSSDALTVAERNARRLGINNIEFIQSEWMQNIDGTFDLIVSNPPYVADSDTHLQQGDVAFEPRTALASGVDGLDDIRLISKQCPSQLRGHLILEHGHDQQTSVSRILNDLGYRQVQGWQDLASIDRCVTACWNPDDE